MGIAIEEAIVEFWKRFDENIDPEPDYRDDADLVIKLNSAAGIKEYQADDDENMKRLVLEYHEVAQVKSNIEKVQEAKKAELLDTIGTEYNKIVFEGFSLSCGMTEPNPGKIITKEMVGEIIGARNGFRQCRVYPKKVKEVK